MFEAMVVAVEDVAVDALPARETKSTSNAFPRKSESPDVFCDVSSDTTPASTKVFGRKRTRLLPLPPRRDVSSDD